MNNSNILQVNTDISYPIAEKLESLETKCSSSPAKDRRSCIQKRNAIKTALTEESDSVSTLRQLAISSGGLLDNEIRLECWPQLLEVDVNNITPKPSQEVLESHSEYNQVVLDVNRSLKRFPPGMEDEVRLSYQDQLIECIMRVLVKMPELHYYQGYHDIVVTILLVLGDELTVAVMEKLSSNHLRDFMDHNMDKTKHILNYLYPIIGKCKPSLKAYMEKAEVGTIFSLSWLITWFGHVLADLKHIVRLYDYFIASHQLMPIYLAAAIVLYREKEILATECEMCYIHSLLSKIPDDLPLEQLTTHAGDLFIQFPPNELEKEANLEAEKSALIRKEQQEEIAKLKLEDALRKTKSQSIMRYWPSLPLKDTHILIKVAFWTFTATFSAMAFTKINQQFGWFL